MSVYQDPRNGHYCYKFMYKKIPYHRCFPLASHKEVVEYERRLRSDLLQNKYDILDDALDASLAQVVKEYKDYRKVNYKRPEEFDYVIDAFYKLIGNKPVSQVTSADIEKYRQQRIGKVENSSINREVDNIKKMFSLAVTNKHLRHSPCADLKKLRIKNHADRFLTSDEEEKLLSKANSIMRLIILVALHTGMRQGEILNLKWEDINFKKGYLTALDTKNGQPRNIPLTKRIKTELQLFTKIGEYVFMNPLTKKKYVNIKKTFSRTVERAGIKKITFHQLRHSSATRMVEMGADIKVVQELLGHSDLNVTQRYAHAVPQRVLDAIRTLNNYSSQNSRKPPKKPKK